MAYCGGKLVEIPGPPLLYRGEVYRSTLWRTRLGTTTNWSVVTLGVALSLVFASPEASPVPLLLVGILILVLLIMETGKYRYFNVWRARAGWIEVNLYAPMIMSDPGKASPDWREILAKDYVSPRYHVSFLTALGRRVQRNYLWILLIQAVAYCAKLTVHPTPLTTIEELVARAALGPIPGLAILSIGLVYLLAFLALAFWSRRADASKWTGRRGATISAG